MLLGIPGRRALKSNSSTRTSTCAFWSVTTGEALMTPVYCGLAVRGIGDCPACMNGRRELVAASAYGAARQQEPKSNSLSPVLWHTNPNRRTLFEDGLPSGASGAGS